MGRFSRWLPAIVVILGVAYIGSSMRPAPTVLDPYTRLAWAGPLRGMLSSGPSSNPRDQMNLAAFGKLPILDKGRIKPIDTFARNHLMLANRREEWRDADGTAQPAVRWLLNLLSAGLGSHVNLMRIDDAAVKEWFGLPADQGDSFGAVRVERQLQARKAEFQKILEKKQNPRTKLSPLEEKIYMTAAAAVTRSQRAAELVKGLGKADDPYAMRVFRIDFDQILHILKLERREGLRYSIEEIGDGALRIRKRAMQGQARIEAKDTRKPADITDHRAIELAEQLSMFFRIGKLDAVRLVPDDEFTPRGWKTLGEALASGDGEGVPLGHLVSIITAYAKGDAKEFNSQVTAYSQLAREHLPYEASNVRQEAWFNHFAPFYRCAILYVLVFLLAVLSWIVAPQPLLRAAFSLLVFVFIVHTFALSYRMYLQWRPPVTNLYSSAVFIGWGCAGVCLLLDWRIYWNGFPTAVGALLGFSTMIIAQYLGGSGDTMAVLEAVLDTNFWLATHVTTVTFGYTATFVAGFLATVYLYRMLAGTVLAFFRNPGNPDWNNPWVFTMALAGVVLIPATLTIGLLWGMVYLFTGDDPTTSPYSVPLGAAVALFAGAYAVVVAMRWFSPVPDEKPGTVPGSAQWMEKLELNVNSAKAMSNEVYGVVCFALLLSFVGTVLGGIWADQSWGRFWGWDPKENGAILVVIVNALILHARWAGMIRERGMVILALVGNMTTMWSWFGTNQLGIGLHSYGFSSALAAMCRWFWIGQLALIGLASLPAQYWKSYTAQPAEKQARAVAGTLKPRATNKADARIAPA